MDISFKKEYYKNYYKKKINFEYKNESDNVNLNKALLLDYVEEFKNNFVFKFRVNNKDFYTENKYHNSACLINEKIVINLYYNNSIKINKILKDSNIINYIIKKTNKDIWLIIKSFIPTRKYLF